MATWGKQSVRRCCQAMAAPFFGPMKNQRINPMSGNSSIITIQSTLAPIEAPLPITLMIAQISKTRIIRQVHRPLQCPLQSPSLRFSLRNRQSNVLFGRERSRNSLPNNTRRAEWFPASIGKTFSYDRQTHARCRNFAKRHGFLRNTAGILILRNPNRHMSVVSITSHGGSWLGLLACADLSRGCG